jgi:hypothetical protein
MVLAWRLLAISFWTRPLKKVQMQGGTPPERM